MTPRSLPPNPLLQEDRAEEAERTKAAQRRRPEGWGSACAVPVLATAVVLLSVVQLRAAPRVDWELRQGLEVTSTGLLKVPLPAETLDAARPALEDLRLLSPSGRETPYLIERPGAPQLVLKRPQSTEIFVEADRTRIVVRRQPGTRLIGLTIDTSAPEFLKAVTVREGDGADSGRVLALRQPVFRQPAGAARLFVELPDTTVPTLTVLLDDQRTPPVPIEGVRLQEMTERAPVGEPVAITLQQRLETPGETRMILDLEAANLTLATLTLDTPEPLFTRPLTLLRRELVGDEIHERTLKSGTVYRVAVDSGESVVQLEMPLELQLTTREIVLRVDNGDSPPLRLDNVTVQRRPVFMVFQASEAGRYTLLTRNALATAPRYDVAALAPQLRELEPSALRWTRLEANPDFQPSTLLPTVPWLAGTLDVSGWAFRRPVFVATGNGVQELELDLDVLARSSRSHADLRLVSDGRQVPFILERTSLQRVLDVPVEAVANSKPTTLSRWILKLPEKSLPITRLVCEVRTTLFDRQLAVVEELPDDRGRSVRRVLAGASWRRTPDRTSGRFWIELAQPPRGDTLFLETDNGDNPGIDLATCQALYPATRILFRWPSETPVHLYYGNPEARAPSYDLGLLAPQILAARRRPAEWGDREPLTRTPWLEGGEPSPLGTILFWGALGLVVIGLVLVIVRLLPNAHPPPDDTSTPGGSATA